MADDAVVAERGVLTAPARAWDLAARRASVIRGLAAQREAVFRDGFRDVPNWAFLART